ncbi:MAG: serine/threonine protein kinase [Deltaproteobacteria bacterium]|nr:serine/threonine protein kinase [Deltaproteobacteria bacterium]
MEKALGEGELIAGRYRLERLLGKGGMGQVWAATHEVTGRRHALKFLNVAEASEELRQRFLREARAASLVGHANVIAIHDVFELEDRTPVMVMDLLEGETLAGKLRRQGRLSLPEAAEIMLPVLQAVAAAHAHAVVHRDLKPDNVFLLAAERGSDRVRVLDFGIAKVVAPEGEPGSVTGAGQVLGTPRYMAPEQCLGEPDIDQRADVWALGAILYEALGGRVPAEGRNVADVVRQLMDGAIVPLGELAPELPAEIASLVMRMLSWQRDERPADLREVAEALAPHAGPAQRLPRVDAAPEVPDDVTTEPRAGAARALDRQGDAGGSTGESEADTWPRAGPPAAAGPAGGPRPAAATRDEPAQGAEPSPQAVAMADELGELVTAALARSGIAGRAAVRGDVVELRGSGAVVAVKLGDWARSWSDLPVEARSRRVVATAARLAGARRAALRSPDDAAGLPRGAAATAAFWRRFAIAVGAVLLAALAWRLVRPHLAQRSGAPAPSAQRPPAAAPADPVARCQEACETARRRIWQGGDATAIGAEGWEVELWLAKRGSGLRRDEQLGVLASSGRVPAALAPELARLAGGGVAFAPPYGIGAQGLGAETAIVRFTGEYVVAYLQPQARSAFEGLASRIAASATADLAALYARCAHLEQHDLGAWYWGHDLGGACAALIFAAGLFSLPPALDPAALGADAGRLDALATAMGSVPSGALAAALGAHGGRVQQEAAGVSLRFSPAGGTDATRASRAIAELLAKRAPRGRR